jgi:hypothetical protein
MVRVNARAEKLLGSPGPGVLRVAFRSITISLTTVLAAISGCWSGASSEGLPCENNVHCGLGLECVNGFCGGEPSDALCGNGWVDPGEACDQGEQNADNGVCRLDCTPETCGDGVQGPSETCDEGEQNDDQGACKTDCTPASCGDGHVGPGEQCDGGDNCSSACTLENCGNGNLDPGEDCDAGGESTDCDDDCTSVACGDGYLNAAAGELCDDGNQDDDYTCMPNCTVPLLWDDMEARTPAVAWTHEKVSGELDVTDQWMVNARNPENDGGRSWDSGLPPNAFGDTRLISPTLDLGSLGSLVDETIQLRFDHARMFSDCDDQDAYEGAVIELSVDGGPFEIITPDDGYTGPVGDGLCTDNPLDGQQAFTLDSFYTTETVDLSAYAGSSIQLGFRVGWDCGNCPSDQTGRGWFIDNVVVSIQ